MSGVCCVRLGGSLTNDAKIVVGMFVLPICNSQQILFLHFIALRVNGFQRQQAGKVYK